MMLAVGPADGDGLGESEGERLGVSDGVGVSEGMGVEVSLGEGDGAGVSVGVSEGEGLGLSVGAGAGVSVGAGDGDSVAVVSGGVSTAKATGPRIDTIIPRRTKTISAFCDGRIRHGLIGRGPNTWVIRDMTTRRSWRRFRAPPIISPFPYKPSGPFPDS
jgi:hypothetical protein